MKILQIATSMTSGGAEALVRDMCIELASRGHVVTVCLICDAQSLGLDPDFETRQRRALKAGGVDIRLLGAECRRWPWLGALRLRRLVSQLKPDVVHTHTTWGAAFAALGRIRLPIVFTQHINRLKYAWAHRVWLHRWIGQYVAICEEALSDIESELGLTDSRLSLIHNGIDLTRFPIRNRSVQHPREFVAIGRLTPQKNYEMLIQAFSSFLTTVSEDQRRSIRLRIYGEGRLASDLRDLAGRFDVAQHVEFCGVTGDVPAVLMQADAYLMASHFEGLSISLIEALAAGLPIVATEVGGNREILAGGKAGYLVPVDQAAFAAAISEVYSSAALRERLVEGCVSHRRHFSIESCTDRYSGLYSRPGAAR